LDWHDVNLAKGTIRVERSMDHKGGLVAPKSRAGTRTVPIPGVLRDLLDAHKLAAWWNAGFVFGATPTHAFNHNTTMNRARRAWAAAGLAPIGLHEARHTAASFFIAAGLNIKALTTFMGHSSVTVSLDRYAKLLAGARRRRRCCSTRSSSGRTRQRGSARSVERMTKKMSHTPEKSC
jgi:integrase